MMMTFGANRCLTIKPTKEMKKNLFMVAAVALMAMVSCNKEDINNGGVDVTPEPTVTVEFEAGFAVETKTALDAEGTKTVWTAEDRISINGQEFKVSEIKEDGKAIFVNVADLPADFAAPFTAIYPYGSDGKVPAEQTAVAGNFDPNAVIETATSETHSLSFSNVTSLLKFQVAAACDAVTLTSDDDLATDSKEVTISGDFVAGSTYYVAVLPGEKANFAVSVDGYVVKSASSVNIATSSIVNMKTLPEPKTIVYMKPSSVWTGMNGRYAAYCWIDDNHTEWYDMADSDNDGIYEAEISVTYKNVIFCSMNASTSENNWDNMEEQTADLKVPSDNNNCYLIFENKWMTVAEAKAFTEPEVVVKKYLYLKPNSNWKADNARFAAYFFGNGERWISMTDSDNDGIYEVELPSDKSFPSVIFCRMNPSTSANNWDNRWNQTADLTIPKDGKNLYTVKDGTWDKGGGTWSTK